MESKYKVVLLSIILITIVIASFFVEERVNMEGRFVQPFGSLYSLIKDESIHIKLSSKEKRFINKNFSKKNTIIINSKDLFGKSSKTVASLIEKDVLNKKRVSFHMLGTDNQGRDIVKMLIVATRNNLILSLIAVFFSIILGMFIGILQGYILNRDTTPYHQKIRYVFSFLINSITSVPMLVWLLIIVLFNEMVIDVDNDFIKTVCTFIFLGSFYYASILSQTIEAHIISLKELEFLSTSEIMGLSKIKIIFNHIIKTNLGGLLLSQSLMIIIQMIMLEITISFEYIDFGLESTISYGTLITGMFKPHSSNMMIPIIFAGIVCSILKLIISNNKRMNA